MTRFLFRLFAFLVFFVFLFGAKSVNAQSCTGGTYCTGPCNVPTNQCACVASLCQNYTFCAPNPQYYSRCPNGPGDPTCCSANVCGTGVRTFPCPTPMNPCINICAGGGGGGGGGGPGPSCNQSGYACFASAANCGVVGRPGFDVGGCGAGQMCCAPPSGGGGGSNGTCQIYNNAAVTTTMTVGQRMVFGVITGGTGTFTGSRLPILGGVGAIITPASISGPRSGPTRTGPYNFTITATAPVSTYLRADVYMENASGNSVVTCQKYLPFEVVACPVPAAPSGLSPSSGLVTPPRLCNAACTDDLDCGGHWVEATLSRNGTDYINSGAQYTKYRDLYFDGYQDAGVAYDDNNARIRYSTITPANVAAWLAPGAAAPWVGPTVHLNRIEGAFAWMPATGSRVNFFSAVLANSGFIDFAVDGKPSGARVPLNSVDNPPQAYPTPIAVSTGSNKSLACIAGACRLKSNTADTLCVDSPARRYVTIVTHPNTAAQYITYFDGIIEDGVTTQETDPRFTYTGTWSVLNSANYSGNSARIGRTTLNSVSFGTTASNLTILTEQLNNVGSMDIYVDGAFVNTVNNYKAAAPWGYRVPISVSYPPKPASTAADTYVGLSWNASGYQRWDLEVYPQGGNCSSAGAYCGRVVKPNYRFVPRAGVSNWSWRVRAVNDQCTPYDITAGTWTGLQSFSTDNSADITSTVSEDLGGNATLVGGVCTLASGATTYTGGGTVRVSKTGYSKTAPISTTDGSYNVTAVPGGTGYTVAVSPTNPAYVVTCPAPGQYTGVSNPITGGGLPFFISPVAGAWFQTVGGDVAALNPGIGTSILNPIPSTYCTTTGCTPHLCRPGVAGNPATAGALIVNSASTVDLDFAAGNQTGNVAATSRLIRTSDPYVCKENYDYFMRLYSMGLNPSDDFPNKANGTLPAQDPPNGAGGKNALFSNGNLTISNPWSVTASGPNGRRVVVFVDGNLNINANITVDNLSFIAFIVSGNIRIGPNVGTMTFSQINNGQVQGVYVSQGQLEVATAGAAGTDRKFIGEGIFVACNGIRLPRDFRNGGNGIENNSNPSSLFIYRPDFVIHTPDKMKSSTINWREAAP